MEKGNRFPRGRGTYYARYTLPCARHGGHEITICSEDDLAWEMAQFIAGALADGGMGDARVRTWFLPRGSRRAPPRIEPTGSEIEDDIPF